MADFPNSPTIGDIANGRIWNGTKWDVVSRKYYEKISVLNNINNTVDIDLSTGNLFELALSDQTTVSFSNPPASGKEQKFYLKLGIDTGYEDVNIGYGIENASYDNVSFSVASQDTAPQDIFFKPDGTKFYIAAYFSDSVHQYTLTTPWDLSTASYDNVSFSVASQEEDLRAIFFKSDGTKMYIIGNTSDLVHQYTLSTPWDLSTASYDSVSFSVASQDGLPISLSFKPDGTKMYIIGVTNDTVFQYALSTAWDVSTASYDSVSFSAPAQDTIPMDISFNPDGTKIYIIGSQNDTVYQYTLSTAWDLSTASYDSVSFSVAGQETSPSGIFLKPDGTKMYIIGTDSSSVHQYTPTASSDTVPNITWPTSIQWETGTAPTLPALGETDLLEFSTSDGGTTYYAKIIADNIG